MFQSNVGAVYTGIYYECSKYNFSETFVHIYQGYGEPPYALRNNMGSNKEEQGGAQRGYRKLYFRFSIGLLSPFLSGKSSLLPVAFWISEKLIQYQNLMYLSSRKVAQR